MIANPPRNQPPLKIQETFFITQNSFDKPYYLSILGERSKDKLSVKDFKDNYLYIIISHFRRFSLRQGY